MSVSLTKVSAKQIAKQPFRLDESGSVAELEMPPSFPVAGKTVNYGIQVQFWAYCYIDKTHNL